MPSAVLSPHLDDAVLSCWHVLAGPGEVTVVNVLTASPAAGTPLPQWDRRTGATDPAVRMRERRAEDARALALAGRGAVALGFLDHQYRGGEAVAAGPVAAAVDRRLPRGTVVHAPAALAGHPDHVLVRDAALALGRAGRPLVLYADLPHGIGNGWPSWVTGETGGAGAAAAAAWAGSLAGAGLAVERFVPVVRPLDAAARTAKLRALDEYRTQRAALDGLAWVPLADPRALAFEVGWRVPRSALAAGEAQRGDVVGEAGGEPRVLAGRAEPPRRGG